MEGAPHPSSHRASLWTRAATTGPTGEPLDLSCRPGVHTARGGAERNQRRPPRGSGASHLARFSVTLRKASCFLAQFLAAASLAIFSPNRSLRPGSKIYEVGMSVACTGPSLRQALLCCWEKPASSHGPHDP